MIPTRFRDRREAGRLLAKKLGGYGPVADGLVLALPRGGVPVAFEVAKALHAPLDVFVVRKLGVPGQEELAMGAITMGGVRVLNRFIVEELGITEKRIKEIAAEEQREVQRREVRYRGDRPAPEIRGRTVILVDDGIATGATMWAALAALREQQAGRLIVAVPVAPVSTLHRLTAGGVETVCVLEAEAFISIGAWYEDFTQTSDEEVCRLLQEAASELSAHSLPV